MNSQYYKEFIVDPNVLPEYIDSIILTLNKASAVNEAYTDKDYILTANKEQMENFIISIGFTAFTTMLTTMRVVRQFNEWAYKKKYITREQLKENSIIDYVSVWDKVRYNLDDKILHRDDFYSLLEAIDGVNSLYIKTLFMAIYEGLYSSKSYGLTELRNKDIDEDNVVTYRLDNDTSVGIKISQKLADNLRRLSTVDSWEVKNKHNEYNLIMDGKYYDSCFKVVRRKFKDDVVTEKLVQRFIQKRILDVSNDILGFKLSANHIYLSGIVDRMAAICKENNMSLKDVLNPGIKKGNYFERNGILREELERIGYQNNFNSFKNKVRGEEILFARYDRENGVEN